MNNISMQEQLNQLFGYLHGMWRYRWSGLLISWTVAIFGWVIVFMLPNQYEANAVIYIDTDSVLKPLLKGLAVETDAAQELSVINRILLSRENLLSVIRETDMDLNVNTARDREKLLQKLAKKIDLKGGGRRSRSGQNIYEISYESASAQRVYQVVSVLLKTMIDNLLNSSRTDTAVAQKFLDRQIKEYEQRLLVAEKKLAEFKKKNIGMMPDEKGGYYSRLQSAQNKAETILTEMRLAKQRSAELYRQLKREKPLISNKSSETTTIVKLNKYQDQLEMLLTRYTDQHPDVLALKQSISELEASAEGTTDIDLDTRGDGLVEFNPVYQDLKIEATKADVEVESLKLQLSEQEERVKKLKSLIDAIPEVEAKLAKLNRDYEITRQRYLEMVDRRESARLAEVAGQSSSEVTVRIIEPPVVPLLPSSPNRVLLLFIVLIIGLTIGMGWCFLRYLMRPTVTNTRQLREEVEMPVFGSVSLNLTPVHIRTRSLQLSAFLSVTFMLVILFSGMVIYKDKGTEVVQKIVTKNSLEKFVREIKQVIGMVE